MPEGASANCWSRFDRVVIRLLRILDATPYIELGSKSKYFAFFLRLISPMYRAQWNFAHEYYNAQRPFFEQAARDFEMHDYWAHMDGGSMDMAFDWLLHVRVRAMRSMHDAEGRDDFKVEKDKCDMLNYFSRNGFPMPPVQGVWRDSSSQFLKQILGGTAIEPNASWPVFLKMCHLTQGSEDSVRRLNSHEWMLNHSKELSSFLEIKWNRRAHDVDRIFKRNSYALTLGLKPGAALQTSFSEPTELKVQVMWGRAYLAYMIEAQGVVSRDGTFEQGMRSRPYGIDVPMPLSKVDAWSWVESEGHLPRVWRLAELAALSLGADQIRIDIFIRRGEPEAVSINEISLTSGQPSHMHGEFLSRIWMEPHLNKRYRLYPSLPANASESESGLGRGGAGAGGATSEEPPARLPLYLQECRTGPCPNREEVLAGLRAYA